MDDKDNVAGETEEPKTPTEMGLTTTENPVEECTELTFTVEEMDGDQMPTEQGHETQEDPLWNWTGRHPNNFQYCILTFYVIADAFFLRNNLFLFFQWAK